MRKEMRKDVVKTINTLVSHSTYCNKCGKERKTIIEDDGYDRCTEYEMHGFSCSFGYYSSYDGENWIFDLCEDCLKEIFQSFKIVPDGFMQDNYNFLNEEIHQKVFDNWKETGEWEEYKYHTYEELIELRNEDYNESYFDEIINKYYPERFK